MYCSSDAVCHNIGVGIIANNIPFWPLCNFYYNTPPPPQQKKSILIIQAPVVHTLIFVLLSCTVGLPVVQNTPARLEDALDGCECVNTKQTDK